MQVAFPKWRAVLALLGALASRSRALRERWAPHAMGVLVQLTRIGVDPPLKAAALRTLRAFALSDGADGADGADCAAAETIWRLMVTAAPQLQQPPPLGAPGAFGGGPMMQLGGAPGQQAPPAAIDGGEELLAGIKNDLVIEQKHQQYPETLAFVRLVRQLLSSCAAAGRPPPAGLTRHMSWIGEELFCCFEAYGFREEAHKWELASGCLAAMLQAVRDYDPARCDAQVRKGALMALCIPPGACTPASV